MARKIALVSAGTYSGKSTLARYLEREYGFLRPDHSRALVVGFVHRWNEVLPYSERISVEQVYANKESWRTLLQEYGYRVGYNDPTQAEKWIRHTLSLAGCSITQASRPGGGRGAVVCPDKDVVFDPARGEVQAQALRGLGFTLVQIEITEDVRRQRAEALGRDYEAVYANMLNDPALEMGIADPDITLDGSLPVEVLAKVLVQRPETLGGYQIFGNHLR